MSNALQVTDFVSSRIVANPEVGVRSDSGRYTALWESTELVNQETQGGVAPLGAAALFGTVVFVDYLANALRSGSSTT